MRCSKSHAGIDSLENWSSNDPIITLDIALFSITSSEHCCNSLTLWPLYVSQITSSAFPAVQIETGHPSVLPLSSLPLSAASIDIITMPESVVTAVLSSENATPQMAGWLWFRNQLVFLAVDALSHSMKERQQCLISRPKMRPYKICLFHQLTNMRAEAYSFCNNGLTGVRQN
jgi:hypothetical protein